MSEASTSVEANEVSQRFYCKKCDIKCDTHSGYKAHIVQIHHTAYCSPCNKGFTRKSSLKQHLKTRWHTQDDMYTFDSFIVSISRWIPNKGEEFTTMYDPDDIYNYVNIVKDEQDIVGHVPRRFSSSFNALLRAGGCINVKVTKEKPIYTNFNGLLVHCTYCITGKLIFIENIKNAL